jgi:VanZ family protein
LKYHIPFFIWLIAIFIESSFPSDAYPKVDIFQADKIVHIGIYGLLGLLCYISLIHQQKFETFYNNPLLWTVLICSLYGASDEFHQYFVPGRDCDFFDWVGDTLGAILAVLVIKYYLQKKLILFKPGLVYTK